ncbi:MAG: hypothetical protein WC244_03500 [Patescibacteria group bacterium]|jgi:hypothetical protein
MKKIILAVFLVVVLIVAGIVAMFTFGLCPPPGPWPMPPWCVVGSELDFKNYQPDYIKYPIATSFKPQVGIGTMDIWGNPHLFLNLGEDTVRNYSSAIKRIGETGSKIYLFTDFINLGIDTEIRTLDRKTFPATYNISEAELKSVVATARANSQERVIMLTNLSDTRDEIEGFIGSANEAGDIKEQLAGVAFKEFTQNRTALTSKDALKTYDDQKWQAFLENLKIAIVNQAKKAQVAGVTDFIINPGDVIIDYYYPGNLSSYWQDVRTEVKQVFDGRVGFFGYPEMISKVDVGGYDFVVVYFEVNGDATARTIFANTEVELNSLKTAWQKYFAQGFWQKIKAEKVLLVAVPSYTDVRTKGWIEPGKMNEGLNPDQKEQALVYEAMFETLAANPSVDDVISYGYWWSANMFPRSKPFRNDLSHSIRNKDTESVFYHWANLNK